MEARKIAEDVASGWPMTAEKYPALAVLEGDQRTNFMLTHVLRHQTRALHHVHFVFGSWFSGAGEREHVYQRAHKIIVNAFRFASVLEFDRYDDIDLDNWESWFERSESARSRCKDYLTDLIMAYEQAQMVLEPVDHGEELPREQLLELARKMLIASIRVASCVGYGREQFSGEELGVA